MKKTLLIAAIVAAGITFAMADDGQPAGRLYKIGEHTVEIDADCMILSVDGSPATLNASVSGHMDFNLANGGIAESEPRPNRHTCKVYAGSDVRTIHIKEQTQWKRLSWSQPLVAANIAPVHAISESYRDAWVGNWVVQRHEMAVAAEQMSQQQQHEKVLELERSQRQRGYDGPTIGWYRKTDYLGKFRLLPCCLWFRC